MNEERGKIRITRVESSATGETSVYAQDPSLGDPVLNGCNTFMYEKPNHTAFLQRQADKEGITLEEARSKFLKVLSKMGLI